MRRTLTIASLSLFLLVPAFASAQDYDTAGEQAMLERVNALRAENELPALARADELDHIARAHSVDMSNNGALQHVSPTSGTPEDRVTRAGIEANMISENVALHRDSAQAQEALYASAPHRANMLSPDVTHVGIGSVRSPQGVYVTQLFVSRPAPAAAEVVEAAPVPAAPELPTFQLIPPFLQGLITPAPEAGAVSQVEVAPVPAAATPAAPSAPAATPAATPAAPAATPAVPAAPAPATTTVPSDALQQLVNFAQSLLS